MDILRSLAPAIWPKLTNFARAATLSSVQTISTHEAKTHLSRYLAAVETGEEIVIARGRKLIARLVPYAPTGGQKRPKVGRTLGPTFDVPDAAFAPLTEEQLKEWGL